MDLATRKLQLMEQLMGVISPESIEKIEIFFKKEISNDSDVWDDIPDVVKQLLEKSKEDSLNGRVRSHEEVMGDTKAKYNISS